MRTLLAEELRDAGLEIIEAGSADEAWDCLHAGASVQLLMSDITMPGSMDGLTLARRVQSAYPGTRIILTSGNFGPGEPVAGVHFLQKPYRLEGAIRLILELVGDAPLSGSWPAAI